MSTFRKSAQIPINRRRKERCPYHRGQEVVFCCQSCDGLFLCVDCAVSTHRGHQLDKIVDLAMGKKESLTDFIHRYEKIEMQSLEEDIAAVDEKMKANSEFFEETVSEIHRRGCDLRRQIDKITRDRIMECRQFEAENHKLLQNYKRELQQLQELIDEKLQECKALIQSESNVMVLEAERELSYISSRPQCPDLQSISFTEGLDIDDELQKSFGSLSIQGGRRVSEFELQQNVHSLCPTTKGCWVSNRLGKTVTLVNKRGDIKQKLDAGSCVCDVSVSPMTGNLWICCENCTVYEVMGSIPTKRFMTDHFPCCMCLTDEDTVVYSTEQKLILQTAAGPMMHKNYKDRQRQNLLVGPHHLSVCPNTGSVAICARDYSTGGGKNTPNVVVLDCNLDLQFRFCGPNPLQEVKMSSMTFDPFDLAFDFFGNLFIADFSCKCLHMISGGDGQYIRAISTDDPPLSLGLQTDSLLWLSHGNKKISIIKSKAIEHI